MKKKYEMPEISLEEMELQQMIALSTDVKSAEPDEPVLSRDEDIFNIINGAMPF